MCVRDGTAVFHGACACVARLLGYVRASVAASGTQFPALMTCPGEGQSVKLITESESPPALNRYQWSAAGAQVRGNLSRHGVGAAWQEAARQRRHDSRGILPVRAVPWRDRVVSWPRCCLFCWSMHEDVRVGVRWFVCRRVIVWVGGL